MNLLQQNKDYMTESIMGKMTSKIRTTQGPYLKTRIDSKLTKSTPLSSIVVNMNIFYICIYIFGGVEEGRDSHRRWLRVQSPLWKRCVLFATKVESFLSHKLGRGWHLTWWWLEACFALALGNYYKIHPRLVGKTKLDYFNV